MASDTNFPPPQIYIALRTVGDNTASSPVIAIVNLFRGENEFGIFQTDDVDSVNELMDVLTKHAAFVDALGRIAGLTAGGPHVSAKDGMAAALESLDRAREIARDVLEPAR